MRKISYILFVTFILSTSIWAGYSRLVARVLPSTVAVLVDGDIIGAGTVIAKEKVLTCAHVASDKGNYEVRLPDGTVYKVSGKVFAKKKVDLAILKVPGLVSKSLPMSIPGRLRVGDMVLTFGSPFGMEDSVILGMVSHLDRDFVIPPYVYDDTIQIDSAINPGNSGGPLVNESGYLVGVVAAKVSNADGLGFAIPVSKVIEFLKEVK